MKKKPPKTTLAIEKAATVRAFSSKDQSVFDAEVPEGTFIVDTKVRIHGTLKRGASFTTEVAAAINPYRLLALALNKLNQTSVDALVEEALKIQDSEDTASIAVKNHVTQALARLVGSTKRETQGRITASLLWERL